MINYPISENKRTKALERLVRYAEKNGKKESGGSKYFNLSFPYCKIRISPRDDDLVKFFVQARPLIIPTYMINRPDLRQDTSLTGLRACYYGTEEGLSEVSMEEIREVNGKLLRSNERRLRVESKLLYPDRKMYDVLILHALEEVKGSR